MPEGLYQETMALLQKAGFSCSEAENASFEMLDFGLGHPRVEGAQIATLCATDRMAVKLIVLLPHQIEPEHYHVAVDGVRAKQELMRVLYGHMDLYIEGEGEASAKLPEQSAAYYTARKKVALGPSGQLVIDPPCPHWFQAGPEGCVALCVSTAAFDAKDVFRNPNVRR